MKHVQIISFIQIVGKLWMGGVAATQQTLSKYDVENMTDENGNITRESVDEWLNSHSGDFSIVIDFRADLETGEKNVIVEWENEENELIYRTYMFGE